MITICMVLKFNLDSPCTNRPLQAGPQEPSQGAGPTNSTTIKVMFPLLPRQGPELRDIRGHREKTNINRAILERTRNKNDDKARLERFISGHYSFCNGFFNFFFLVFILFGLSDWSQLNYSL